MQEQQLNKQETNKIKYRIKVNMMNYDENQV